MSNKELRERERERFDIQLFVTNQFLRFVTNKRTSPSPSHQTSLNCKAPPHSQYFPVKNTKTGAGVQGTGNTVTRHYN